MLSNSVRPQPQKPDLKKAQFIMNEELLLDVCHEESSVNSDFHFYNEYCIIATFYCGKCIKRFSTRYLVGEL